MAVTGKTVEEKNKLRMTVYAYKARNKQGELVSGTLEAEDERGVIGSLDKQGYSVVEIASAKKQDFSLSGLVSKFKRTERREVIVFTRQLAALLRSGTALSASLNAVCDQTVDRKFKAILEDIRRSVQGGSSFSEALSKHPGVFSELFISMVEVGETGGMLDKVLERLAHLGTQELEMQAKITSALIYPVVLVVVAFIIVNFLIIGVLPKFVTVFLASQANLPLPTQLVMGLSFTLRRLWYVILLALAGGVMAFRAYIHKEEGRFKFHRWLLKVPLFGPLYSKIQVSRFARTVSTLIASGIPLLQALTVVEKTVSNLVIRREIQKIRFAISEGRPLVEQFKASGLFTPMVVQMISTGEKSGQLDQMLNDIALFYDPEIEQTITNLTALLEPFMLLTMGVMVAFIAISVLLPIFNLIKVFRG